jgi:hypothetical protein
MQKGKKKAARKALVAKKLKPNKFYKQIEKDGGLLLEPDGQASKWIPLPQGRPRKGELTEPSTPRSVRLPDSVWSELQARAKERGVGVHTLLRELVAQFMGKVTKTRKRVRKAA